MNHYANSKPPHETDRAAWLAALLAQCRGLVIPPEFAGALQSRLGRLSFTELLNGMESIAGNTDRRLAVQLYGAWIAACTDPAQPRFAAWFNLGAELVNTGDIDAGINAYRNAVALKPDFHAASLNLGLQLEVKGDLTGALATWAQALQSNDARTALLNQRARLLETNGHLADAERELTISLATEPAQYDVIQHWVHIRQKMCRWPVLAPPPGLTITDLMQDCGPLACLSLMDDVAMQTVITTRWLQRKTPPAAQHLAPAGGYPGHDRIRIGYLSSDLCRHAMGYLVPELFERHDRARFEVYGYCIGRDDGSALRARIVAGFDHFTTLSSLTDEAAARAIAADEIDILVDLNGLTAGARPQILRWKPAPIQATYLGFIGPMPMPELDYLFCDDFVIPDALVPSYRPAPLRIAPIFQVNDRLRVIGPPTTRAAIGLPEDAFVFCCFANHYKVTQAMFSGWMAILALVPGSVLWLAQDNAWSEANMRDEAIRYGIDPARLLIASRVDPADYIARLPLADLFLDTHPYNAGTIASDALRMGLPLLTLCGQSFVARMAARMLTAIGAVEGITHTLPEYVQRAAALANDPAAYAAYRARFTREAWEATIGDIAGFTAAYEATLLGLVARAEAPVQPPAIAEDPPAAPPEPAPPPPHKSRRGRATANPSPAANRSLPH
jgi:predicted O-linked N-acetylglucosamine transferase (SPINDLY family)